MALIAHLLYTKNESSDFYVFKNCIVCYIKLLQERELHRMLSI